LPSADPRTKISTVELRGVVRADLPLLVVALEEEADALDDELPILVTGPGKVHATAAVTATLASARPSVVINLGTAGGLHDGLHGVHEIHTVIQHDFDAAVFRALVNRDYGMPITLDADADADADADSGAGAARMVLATGDYFVADSDVRAALSRDAHLVDMEGYAVAWAARTAGVPVRLVKLVSDDASDGAARTWVDTVDEHARALSRWVRDELRCDR